MTFSIVLASRLPCGILERERVVHVFLQRHDRAAAETAIGGDDQLGLAIKNAVRDRLRAEAAEHDR